MFADFSTFWENTYGCVDQYRCDTALYLLSILDHTYDIIIYRVIGAPRHGREIVDGIYTTDKIFIPLLMKNSQFLGSKGYDYQMEI